jgi:rhodanese-related sulfurtransferase
VAAQLLSGKGFTDIINVAGGFNAWTSKKAFMGEEKGLGAF